MTRGHNHIPSIRRGNVFHPFAGEYLTLPNASSTLPARIAIRGIPEESMSFQVVIVTPEQQVLDETVTQAILPAHDGQIGILTGRAPLLVKLGQGPLQLDLASGSRGAAGGSGGAGAGGSRMFYIEGGIAQMRDNNLTVVTQMAVPAEEISADTARAELAEATAQVVPATDEKAQEDRTRRMNRARAMHSLATSR
ncbi:MAG: F-type H+-transporting ATPase subunit epsilon [Phycisphaerales bacterium]|nr:F-type H+-transporting ATPase subunit epsilon [Phycisphaerales bacterium]